MKKNKENPQQTINSLNNYNLPANTHKHKHTFEQKYQIDAKITNKYAAWMSNPTVQPDNKTEMGVPIPDKLNTEFSKEYQEFSEL